MNDDREEQLLIASDRYLRKLCYGHWCALEPEDRLEEVKIAFLCAYRSFPTNTGHFLDDFETALTPYMKELNRRTRLQRFARLSLETPLRTKKDAADCTLVRFCRASQYDESGFYVRQFLSSLSPWQQSILRALLDGTSKAAIARQHCLSYYQLNCILRGIGERYKHEYDVS